MGRGRCSLLALYRLPAICTARYSAMRDGNSHSFSSSELRRGVCDEAASAICVSEDMVKLWRINDSEMEEGEVVDEVERLRGWRLRG
jgi:hypothetical protein